SVSICSISLDTGMFSSRAIACSPSQNEFSKVTEVLFPARQTERLITSESRRRRFLRLGIVVAENVSFVSTGATSVGLSFKFLEFPTGPLQLELGPTPGYSRY